MLTRFGAATSAVLFLDILLFKQELAASVLVIRVAATSPVSAYESGPPIKQTGIFEVRFSRR